MQTMCQLTPSGSKDCDQRTVISLMSTTCCLMIGNALSPICVTATKWMLEGVAMKAFIATLSPSREHCCLDQWYVFIETEARNMSVLKVRSYERVVAVTGTGYWAMSCFWEVASARMPYREATWASIASRSILPLSMDVTFIYVRCCWHIHFTRAGALFSLPHV